MDKLKAKDEYFLDLAVTEAQYAWNAGNAPIGAVLTSRDGAGNLAQSDRQFIGLDTRGQSRLWWWRRIQHQST